MRRGETSKQVAEERRERQVMVKSERQASIWERGETGK
jgi:hypothetical protein